MFANDVGNDPHEEASEEKYVLLTQLYVSLLS